MAIQDEIRKAREALKITPAELARRAGIQRSLLGKIERGDNFTIETLEKIVAHLPNLETLHIGSKKIQAGGPAAELHVILADHLEASTALANASTATTAAAEALVRSSAETQAAIRRLAATSTRLLAAVEAAMTASAPPAPEARD